MTDHNAATCTTCGDRLVPIAYGYPGIEMWEAEERGELVLGGCMMDPGRPASTCRSCGRTSGSLD